MDSWSGLVRRRSMRRRPFLAVSVTSVMVRSWPIAAPDSVAIAGSPAGEASTKKRSALLTLYVEPPTIAARDARDRHVGAAHPVAVQVRDRRFGGAADLRKPWHASSPERERIRWLWVLSRTPTVTERAAIMGAVWRLPAVAGYPRARDRGVPQAARALESGGLVESVGVRLASVLPRQFHRWRCASRLRWSACE